MQNSDFVSSLEKEAPQCFLGPENCFTENACTFLASIVYDICWQSQTYKYVREKSPLKAYSSDVASVSPVFDLWQIVSDHFGKNPSRDNAIDLLFIINRRVCGKRQAEMTELLKYVRFNPEDYARVGLFSLPDSEYVLQSEDHIIFIKDEFTPMTDEILCKALELRIERLDSNHYDIIFFSGLPNKYANDEDYFSRLAQLDNFADVVYCKVSREYLEEAEKYKTHKAEDLREYLGNSPYRSWTIIQIGPKTIYPIPVFIMKSFVVTDSGSLFLRYYHSYDDYNQEIYSESRFCFYPNEQKTKELTKARILSYDIDRLWSFIPSDYIFFGSERLFIVQLPQKNVENKLEGRSHLSYPVWCFDKNDETLLFLQNPEMLKKERKQNKNLNQFYYMFGNIAVIPTDMTATITVLLRAIIKFLEHEGDLIHLEYWMPFVKFSYTAANVWDKEEAEYRLQEWLKKHHSEYIGLWNEFREKTICSIRGRLMKETPYENLTQDVLVDKFPFCKKEKTDIALYIRGWSSDGTKEKTQNNVRTKKRECRKQPILNLMLASFGISREQHKYLEKVYRERQKNSGQ